MHIISRARWGARYSNGFGVAPLPASEVWLHHSVTLAPDLVWVDVDGDGIEDDEQRAMRTLEDIGQARFGGGISYTFAVMPSGRIYEGHSVDRKGSHTGGRNSLARAIVLVGDYTTRPLTGEQQRAVARLLQHGHAAGWWRTARLNGGHRQAPGASTACPGDAALAAIPSINALAAGGPVQEADMLPDERNAVMSTFLAIYSKGGSQGDQSIIERLVEIQRNTRLLPQVVAAVTNDPDIDTEQVAALLNAAVAEHTPSAEEIAAAQRPFLAAVVREALGEDNADQADRIVDELVSRLANPTPEGN